VEIERSARLIGRITMVFKIGLNSIKFNYRSRRIASSIKNATLVNVK
jgi:hypothetical protein